MPLATSTPLAADQRKRTRQSYSQPVEDGSTLTTGKTTTLVVPKPSKLVDSLFLQWLLFQNTLSGEGNESFVSEALRQISDGLAADYSQRVTARVAALVAETHTESQQCCSPIIAEEEELHVPPPRSPGRSRKSMLQTTEPSVSRILDFYDPSDSLKSLNSSHKTDSGVDLLVNSSAIPAFYFPKGCPSIGSGQLAIPGSAADNESHVFEAKLREIFSTRSDDDDDDDDKNETKYKLLFEQDFVPVTLLCKLPRYINAAFFKKASGFSTNSQSTHKQPSAVDSGLSFSRFMAYWSHLISTYFGLDAICFGILKDSGNSDPHANYITPKDIELCVHDVTLNHPGLEFLSSLHVFQNRYVETVVTRLFYAKPRNWNKKMTLAEFRKSGFVASLQALEKIDDINWTQDVFSYQHFYVIYCKFWELDRDHDMVIDLPALRRYDNGSMTESILRRVVEGYGKEPSLGRTGSRTNINNCTMSYEDFIWFILSVEEKKSVYAIEYWFRCLDLDGDGCLSLFELRYFFEDQFDRMMLSRMSDLWRFEDFICSL